MMTHDAPAVPGPDGEAEWLARARAAGDPAGEEAALDLLIEAEPRSVRGHVAKGMARARAGDEQIACYYFRVALRLAEGRQWPPETSADIAQARTILAEMEARAHHARAARLADRGLPSGSWSPRLAEALDIAAGRKRLYVQEPTAFTWPGLPHAQYHDAARFAWAPALEAAAPAIRAELSALLDIGTDAFRPYIQSDSSAVPLQGNRALLNSRDWSVLALCENGWLMPDIIERCPRTWAAVLAADVPRVAGWGPTIVFSMLRAGAHIAPHTGMFNTRLICHLPLIVPPGCRFRVGNEIREWEEGKLLIFDDTIEHEAWNDGPDDRVVLIFDIWRPELSERERHELTALFSD